VGRLGRLLVDIPFGPQLLTRIGEAYRKIRNTARYLLSNLHDFDPATNALPLDELADARQVGLGRATRIFERCRQAYDEYEFHVVYHRILELCTVDLSQVYLDISKDTVYCEAPDSPLRRSAQTAMYLILRGIVAYMAPIMSFTADEIYEAMPGPKAQSVHVTDFPAYAPMPEDTAWERCSACAMR
jgi:isoleucyl-tRNA synthetase